MTGEDFHIDTQPAWVTSIAWPQVTSQDEPEHLLVGTINGSVALLTIFPRNKQREELVHCSQQYGKWEIIFLHFRYLFITHLYHSLLMKRLTCVGKIIGSIFLLFLLRFFCLVNACLLLIIQFYYALYTCFLFVVRLDFFLQPITNCFHEIFSSEKSLVKENSVNWLAWRTLRIE